MRTLTWTTSNGANLEAQIEYSATYYPSHDIDGGWGGATRESYCEDITVTLLRDGQILGVEDRLPMQITPGYHGQHLVDAGCTVVFTLRGPAGEYLRIGTDGITMDDFNSAVEEMRQAEAPAEVLRLVAAKQTRRQEEERRDAEEILACTHVFDDDAARRAWERRYNDVVNEGGEGYIPMTVTVAQQEHARAVLERINGTRRDN